SPSPSLATVRPGTPTEPLTVTSAVRSASVRPAELVTNATGDMAGAGRGDPDRFATSTPTTTAATVSTAAPASMPGRDRFDSSWLLPGAATEPGPDAAGNSRASPGS